MATLPPPSVRAAPPQDHVAAGARLRAGLALGAWLLPALAGIALLAGGMPVAGAVLLAIGVALVVATWSIGSPARLAARIGGRTAEPGRDERLLNLAEGLCVAGGLAMPEMRVLGSDAANAVLLAPGRRDAVLIVTQGLLDRLERVELEGVLAHELSHLRRGDAGLASVATRAAGLPATVSARATSAVLRLAGPDREPRADLAAASLTRYPPGLAAALDKLAGAPTRPDGLDPVAVRLTAPLWCAPLAEAVPARPLAGALSLPERAAMLNEL